ncbi:hypothetical protein [Aureliella helgolandensis]|uniref:Chromosome partition protein Smc n=1 Tax=Aureliella helgolandensis TaxID=2527968 RepID=A0A518G236_9BACT|nr:hypothetical protein [Aureliella helgolandensis]QDV22673.1 hypothetical protein Q31a_09590 [Aureliella helgolandensis]
MTLLGKVFTAIIAVLSVIFFALAVAVNASHLNQKEIADAANKRATTAQNKNTQLAALLDETKSLLAIEQMARRSALAALQTQLEQAKTELEMQATSYADLLAAHTELVQTEKTTQLELKSKTDDNELLRKQNVDETQNKNQLFDRLVSTKDQYNRLQGNYETLLARRDQLLNDFTAAKENLDILGIKPDTLLDGPPAVNGQVLAVDTSGMVEVSLGRDDGMREGFTLDVHRGGQYLGKLKVRTVRDNKSVAEILTGYQRGYIREGDRVDSKLY